MQNINTNAPFDMIIVGAGLSGLLTAWRCLSQHEDMRICVVDAADSIAGDHTWSFHATDIPSHLSEWLAPFVTKQWDDYEVKFPEYTRKIDLAYCSGDSDSLRACLEPFIASQRLRIVTGQYVTSLNELRVTLKNGQVLQASCVLDARGFMPVDARVLGYQKFVGFNIKTQQPHGVVRPIIMDATVEQIGGYRFVYCLPYSNHDLLVEDTYYTDGSELDLSLIEQRIHTYIASQLGIDAYDIVRREKGVLPITLAQDAAIQTGSIGLRGGFFHAVTGYSLPNAVRVADIINRAWSNGDTDLKHHIQAEAQRHYKNEAFFRLLNRMLFRAANPQTRYSVLARFYKLSQPLIARFYASQLTRRDKIRILSGRPPVPIHKAVANLSESRFLKRHRSKEPS